MNLINRFLMLLMLIVVLLCSYSTTFAGTTSYTYDEMDRLKSVDFHDGYSIFYEYDKTGNLLSKTSSDHYVLYENFNIFPGGWSAQGTVDIINSSSHSASNSLILGNAYNSDGSVTFVAPAAGNLYFWYYKYGSWGYYFDSEGDCPEYGTNAGTMTVSVNGTVVYTATADTGWTTTPTFSVNAGDTITIAQVGNHDDGGGYCDYRPDGCVEGEDRYDNITVYIDDVTIVGRYNNSTPPVTTVSLAGGLYPSARTVSMSVNKSATIYYTTDGTTPTTSSAVYSAPLIMYATTTLKYFARDLAGNSEAVKTQVYSIDTTAPVTMATPPGGTYMSTQTVALSANESATIYYTTDDSTPTTGSAVYTAPLTISANTTLKYFARDLVGNIEAVKSQTYIIGTMVLFENFNSFPGAWSVQGTASINYGSYHSAGNSLMIGDGYNTDGSVTFAAPASGNLSFWYYKSGAWGYYWDWEDFTQYGVNAGSMTVSVNGAVVFTATADTGWVKSPSFTVHAGDTITITQTGSHDDGGDYCYEYGPCSEGDDRYDNVNVYIDDVIIMGSGYIDTTPPVTAVSLAGGTFSSAQTVTMSANESATIYYTTNGTTPTTTSTVYTAPLIIFPTATLKYFARDLAGNAEAVKTEIYTLDTIPPVTTVTPPGGTYSSARTVTLSANESATIYYTTNGTTPTTSSAVYTAPLTISASTTLKYFARDLAGNVEAVKTEIYTLDTTPPVTTATPPGGASSSAQTVTLSANEPATIYYTTNGSTPTTSSAVYTAPLTISATTTLKYFAKDQDGNLETVKTQVYSIVSGYFVSFATPAIPAGWSDQGTASFINSSYHSAGYSLFLGNGYNTDGSVTFAAPTTGNFSFWYYKSGAWGYYWDLEDFTQYGVNAGSMTVSVNGSVVFTATADTGWVKTPSFTVHVGDTITITQSGSHDDGGDYCYEEGPCSEGEDRYDNVNVYIDDVSIE